VANNAWIKSNGCGDGNVGDGGAVEWIAVPLAAAPLSFI
jgi:hypothetical protein